MSQGKFLWLHWSSFNLVVVVAPIVEALYSVEQEGTLRYFFAGVSSIELVTESQDV
jgi:hypothetical protein